MMIAARLAGGNLFLPFCGGGFCGGDFWSTRSSSEHSDFFLRGFFLWGFLGALGAARSTRSTLIFFEGVFWWGDSFFGGWWGAFWIVSVGKN